MTHRASTQAVTSQGAFRKVRSVNSPISAITLGLLMVFLHAGAAAAAPKLVVTPSKPMAGAPVLVTVRGAKNRPSGSALGKELEFYPVRGGWQALFAVPLDDPPPKLDVVIRDLELKDTLEVQPRDSKDEEVEVDPAFAVPPNEKAQQISDENRAVIEAVQSDEPPKFRGRFVKPGGGKVTSRFGEWRTFNGHPETKSRHLGLDYGAPKGAAVKAINAGNVTLVSDTYLMGQVVVIDHGGGIGSAYFHLDNIRVKLGDEVKRGQRIGAAGTGGRTTGPHIHLSVWVREAFVDPAGFLGLPLLPARADNPR